MVLIPFKSKYDQLTLRKYFMHTKMNNTRQSLHYIKKQAFTHTLYADMTQKNRFYLTDTAKTVNGIHNKEVSTVRMLLCLKLTQIELKCSIQKSK